MIRKSKGDLRIVPCDALPQSCRHSQIMGPLPHFLLMSGSGHKAFSPPASKLASEFRLLPLKSCQLMNDRNPDRNPCAVFRLFVKEKTVRFSIIQTDPDVDILNADAGTTALSEVYKFRFFFQLIS